MGRTAVPGPAGGDRPRRPRGGGRAKRRPPGLAIIERDGFWHVVGTVRVAGGGSKRIRRSTELPARNDLWVDADQVLRTIEREAIDEAITGIRKRFLAVAAREYLGLKDDGTPISDTSRVHAIGPTDLAILDEMIAKFGRRLLTKIPAKDWNRWLDARHDGNAADTRARFCNPIVTFLEWCADGDRAYLEAMPAIKKRPDTAAGTDTQQRAPRRPVEDMTPELLTFLFDQAHLAIKAQLYAEWSTGARVSSVLFGCTLGDLVLGETRQQLTYRETKNGDDVVAMLLPPAVAVLKEYLAWRGNLHLRTGPLFLTPRKQPYSDRGRRLGWGGANKTGVNAMKRRAILILLRWSVQARRAGEVEAAIEFKAAAKLVRRITQHWLRHWLATHSMAAEIPKRMVMAQQGWRSEASVSRYEHDVTAVRRKMLERVQIGGTPLTRKLAGEA